MSNIRITDNHEFISLDSQTDSRYWHDIIDTNAIDDLRLVANVQIGNLKIQDHPNLLVFPKDLHQNGDEISESHIISMKDDMISTGNIMGFVGVNDTQLDIKSRFAQKDGEDYFLHYMLQKVFAINLFDIKHTTNEQQIFDFLLYLFPYYLKKALAQGLFKKYRRFEHNDANIRGPINISRHIRENIPFRGTVAYTTREHSYDNEITQLVRHTIEYIRTSKFGSGILNNDTETKECISQIVMATQSYNARERQKVINQNLRPIRHPYYSEYTPLQKICLQILRHESLKYGHEKDKIYGILFDGAWLWEEYLNKIFIEHKLDITHAENKTGKNGIQLYKGSNKYFPDFYRKTKDDNIGDLSLVLDAKYKRLGKNSAIDEQNGTNNVSISRDDLFQMITYLHVLPAKKCALIYPIEPNETSNSEIVVSSSRELYGLGGEIYGIGLRIPTVLSGQKYSDFCMTMNGGNSTTGIEKSLIETLKKWNNKTNKASQL